jgi:hypothetical protein
MRQFSQIPTKCYQALRKPSNSPLAGENNPIHLLPLMPSSIKYFPRRRRCCDQDWVMANSNSY